MTNDVPGDAPRRPPVQVLFRAVAEELPGTAWQDLFRAAWPGWLAWLTRAGARWAPATAERALRRHMPEFAATWERLAALAGDDPRAAQFLTFWSPPRYLAGCSQAAVLDADGPALIRNYDLDPALNEGCCLATAWHGRRVIGMAEGIAGLADGMNGDGLAVSLAFGGRPVTGPGFGVPLIVRYLLEFCADVADAVEALRRLPSHMSYNLTLADRSGAAATVMIAPDRPAVVTAARYATNHQFGVSWPLHARLSRTLERAAHLAAALPHHSREPDLARLFLTPPIHSRRYGEGFGTVYTALYRPAAGTAALLWPGQPPWRQSFARFRPGERLVGFTDGAAPRAASLQPS
jgi:predicted choloylglycine hydrolase